MTLENIVILILSFLLLSSIAYAMVLYKDLKRSESNLLQALADKLLILDQLSAEIDKNYSNDTNDSFIKFLSDSRDAAFDYIETAQLTIMEFVSIADKISFARSTDKELIKQYKESYSKLIDLLPIVNDAVER